MLHLYGDRVLPFASQTAEIAGASAIAGRHRQRGLAPAETQRDHPIVTVAGSHPDCRAVLIQIVALYQSVIRGMQA